MLSAWIDITQEKLAMQEKLARKDNEFDKSMNLDRKKPAEAGCLVG